MSARNPEAALYRQLHDLRVAAVEAERELTLLHQEQRHLDAQIAATEEQQAATASHRFWHGFGFALVTVGAVWSSALGLAHFLVNR